MIASEASYIYILSGQKLFKNAQNGSFWRVFENLKLAVKQRYQTGLFSGQNDKRFDMTSFANVRYFYDFLKTF